MHISLIIDCSGSMSGQEDVVTEQVRDLIKKNTDKDTRFTLIEFDSTVKVVAKKNKGTIKKFKNYKMETRGMTALFDAVGKASEFIDPAEKNMVFIITDGLENSSEEWTSAHVVPLIKAWEATETTDVTFIGSGLDAMEAYGDRAGAAFTMSSDGTTAGTVHYFAAMDQNIRMSKIGISKLKRRAQVRKDHSRHIKIDEK